MIKLSSRYFLHFVTPYLFHFRQFQIHGKIMVDAAAAAQILYNTPTGGYFAQKRGGGETPLVLSELGDIVSGTESVEQELVRKELLAEINGFLAGLSKEKRQMFVRRYWFAESIGELAGRFGISEGNTTMTLKRIRLQLKEMLLKKGYQL